MSKLYFRYGAMNSGKTTALLQVCHNYEERGMNIILIKPSIDVKGNDCVSSRLGVLRKVDFLIDNKTRIVDIIDLNNKPNAIIVDEAQFLEPYQVDELYYISKMYDIPVITYGLRCDFQMKGFPGATRLLEIADDIEELKTICRCGKKATQNMRLLDDQPIFEGEQILIDGTSNMTHESVCGKCYLEYRNNIKVRRK